MKKYLTILTAISILSIACNLQKEELTVQQKKDSNGYFYEVIKNDPTGLRLYSLKNGLKVYLSKNNDSPKIQTYIAVQAGSNYDPKESTGLAHYLEHMLFKGTKKIGTKNWEAEKRLIKEISDLYEEHKKEDDSIKKIKIYRKIDSISLEASKYSIANEYDNMISSLGATGTNAHTWYEETVYKNKIPKNELSKWLKVEGERFSKLVLRLFHTELETVFEEFNRSQDNDYRKSYYAMLKTLFPNHPYGQQTTIGTAHHLKNPSMVSINNYFDKYYAPSNMAVVLVGDLEFEKTIKLVDKYFGRYQNKEVIHPKLPKEKPITKIVEKEVFGPTAENVSIAFRSEGIGSKDEKIITLIDMILSNSVAGLIDINLNQKQEVQNANCRPLFLNDYGIHQFYGTPKSGQTLEEVKQLILNQIELIKQGEFEDWMLEATINDLKLNQIKSFENITSLASSYYKAFINRQNWKYKLTFLDELEKISKQELIDFANKFYDNNYVVVYKRQDIDPNIVKVANPKITPINLNRGEQSKFVKEFNNIPSEKLSPLFVNYQKEIKKSKLKNGIEISYIPNKNNDLFNLVFIFDAGKDHIKELALASGYMNYLGTDTLSPEDLKKEFYKLGISYNLSVENKKCRISISGLKDNLEKGLVLIESFLENVTADQNTYDKYVKKILKNRIDGKSQKSNILWNGLLNYAKYGENSRLRSIYNSEELKKLEPKKLVEIIKNLKNYKPRIFYYGKDIKFAVETLNKYHKVKNDFKEYPKPAIYSEIETGNKINFVHYDMVQAELIFVAKQKKFNKKNLALSKIFNSYFGSGLSSIVFQEIRESKSLAYSAFAVYSNAKEKEESNYVYAYMGTQANKLPEAINEMLNLMNHIPTVEKQFLAAKESALKEIASERITKSSIFWSYENLLKRGIKYDIREEIYNEIKKITMQDLVNFFNKNIKGSNYSLMLIGNKNDLDLDLLKKLGKVEELDIDYLFNYKKND